jgi:hypothetical protein
MPILAIDDSKELRLSFSSMKSLNNECICLVIKVFYQEGHARLSGRRNAIQEQMQIQPMMNLNHFKLQVPSHQRLKSRQ